MEEKNTVLLNLLVDKENSNVVVFPCVMKDGEQFNVLVPWKMTDTPAVLVNTFSRTLAQLLAKRNLPENASEEDVTNLANKYLGKE